MQSQVRNAVNSVCLDTGSVGKGSLLVASCHGSRGNQGFMFTMDHQLRSGSYCLAAQSAGIPVRKVDCMDRNDGINEQYWTYDKVISQSNEDSKICSIHEIQ